MNDRERERRRAYYLANQDRIRQRVREWYIANPDRVRERGKAYREANRERIRERKRAYYAANRDREDQRVKNWNVANPDRAREIKQRSQAARRARDLEKARAKGRKEKAARRARKADIQCIPYTAEQLALKVAYWGNRCYFCGGAWTQIDHVKPIVAGGGDILCNLRPICKPCNSGKHGRWPFPIPMYPAT